MNEVENIKERYKRRENLPFNKSSYLHPSIYLNYQERERKFIKWLKYVNFKEIEKTKLLEIGSGNGFNLSRFIQLGFNPQNIVGNDLLKERVIKSRKLLPSSVQIIPGDARKLVLNPNSFEVVFQSMVFSSILDNNFRVELANKMWSLVKPGGGVLWYDFTYNNAKNPDVKGVKKEEIIRLFPSKEIKIWKLTLAPPVSRLVTEIYPPLYYFFNLFPFLRTHILCWIKKNEK